MIKTSAGPNRQPTEPASRTRHTRWIVLLAMGIALISIPCSLVSDYTTTESIQASVAAPRHWATPDTESQFYKN